jgi:hypothetical protein
MAKDEGTPVKLRETRGGYPSGDKLISDLKPPPPGPAPGAKAKPSNVDSGKGDSGESHSETKRH